MSSSISSYAYLLYTPYDLGRQEAKVNRVLITSSLPSSVSTPFGNKVRLLSSRLLRTRSDSPLLDAYLKPYIRQLSSSALQVSTCFIAICISIVLKRPAVLLGFNCVEAHCSWHTCRSVKRCSASSALASIACQTGLELNLLSNAR